jgi:hypothetical protein
MASPQFVPKVAFPCGWIGGWSAFGPPNQESRFGPVFPLLTIFADRARTSHSFISKVEGGDHMPTIPVLKRILAVLDEELLIGIERQVPDEEPERELAPVPELAAA